MHWIAPAKTDAANDTLEKRFRVAVRQRQIQTVCRSRDMLPRLLSGQVNLKEN